MSERDELAKALRTRGFWATHSDRWNDEQWQRALWTDLADGLLASPQFARLIAEAEARGIERAEAQTRQGILADHVRESSTDQGPDFCRTCSDAISDWVKWPCAATATARAEAEARGAARVRDAVEKLADDADATCSGFAVDITGTPFSARVSTAELRAALKDQP